MFPSFSKQFSLLLLLLLFGSLVFWVTDLDLFISDYFYNRENKDWPAQEDGTFWKLIYTYGVIPALLAILGSILTIMRSYITPNLRLTRIKAWCIILAIVLGPGLIVNGIFKPHFGRPRPYDIQRYDGEQQYQRLLVPGIKGESFPAGHPSSGFALTILFLLAYPRSRKKAWVYLSAALTLGVLLGIARVSQGGHFTSDVLWSFGMTQIVNLLVYYKLLKLPAKEFQDYPNTFVEPSVFKRIVLSVSMIVISGGFIFAFLIASPVTHFQYTSVKIPKEATSLVLSLDLKDEEIHLMNTSKHSVDIDYLVLAHGLPWTKFLATPSLQLIDSQASYGLKIQKKGLTREYRGRIKLFVPSDIKIISKIKTSGVVLDKRPKK